MNKKQIWTEVRTILYVARGMVLNLFFCPKKQIDQEKERHEVFMEKKSFVENEVVNKLSKNNPKKMDKWRWIAGGIVIFIMLIAKHVNMPGLLFAMGGMLLLLLLFGWIGSFLAIKYLKRKKSNLKLMNILVWGNLFTWIIPATGILTAVYFWKIGKANKKKLYMILSAICFCLSLITLGFTLVDRLTVYYLIMN